MHIQGLSLIFPLFICFFIECFCICDRAAWTKVGWEIFPEEIPYLKVPLPPSHCLPYPLDRLCCSFGNKDTLYVCLHLIYISLEALGLILFVLSVHYLWMKWKKHKKKLETKATPEPPSKAENQSSSYDIDQILCKLIATTSMMTKYLNQVFIRPPAKKGKHRKGRGKRTKEKEPKEKEPKEKEPEETKASTCKCGTASYEDYARNLLTELM
ncbi:testis-expressed protein 50 [Sorex araneus]|uniref:testis-expressed protein 50 n=1 Tax=Sorex araneus TaxID=42254 RepID=UPI0006495900|nr:testis-expressed protein 50 [Sorex araneus]